MKKTTAIIVITMLLATAASAQDCNCPDKLFVFNGGVGFTKGIIMGTARVGLWRNAKPGGITLLAGYQDAMPFNAAGKDNAARYLSSFLIEAGYKNRINRKLIWNLYAGSTKVARYAGLQVFYQMNETLLMGFDYRNRIVGMSVVARFN